jgi:hypothetical protein
MLDGSMGLQVGVTCMDDEHERCTRVLNAMLLACAPAPLPESAHVEVFQTTFNRI